MPRLVKIEVDLTKDPVEPIQIKLGYTEGGIPLTANLTAKEASSLYVKLFSALTRAGAAHEIGEARS